MTTMYLYLYLYKRGVDFKKFKMAQKAQDYYSQSLSGVSTCTRERERERIANGTTGQRKGDPSRQGPTVSGCHHVTASTHSSPEHVPRARFVPP